MKKKKIIILLICIALIISIIGIWLNFFKDDYPNIKLESKNISNQIIKDVGIYMTSLKEMTEEEIRKEYNIDLNGLDNYSFKTALTAIRSDRLIIIKVKNIYEISNIKNKILEGLKNKEKDYVDFLADQYEIIKNPIILIRGKYILISVSEENDKIEKEFLENFN